MPTRTTIGNLGTPSCNKQTGKPIKFIKVAKKDSTGALNFVPSGTTIDQTFLDGKIRNLDLTQRWYMSPSFKNFDSPKEDPIYQTFGDGSKSFLREGLRTFTGDFIELGSDFLCYLKPLDCKDECFYIVTEKNNLVGYDPTGSGNLYPMPMEELVTKLNMAKDDSVESVMFTIDIPITLLDCQMKTVYDSTADFVNTNGLIQMEAVASSPTGTGYSVTMTVYGMPYTALDATDITGYDETASASIAVTSITGGSNGTYVIAFTSPTSTNVVRTEETAVLTAKGFSFQAVTETIA